MFLFLSCNILGDQAAANELDHARLTDAGLSNTDLPSLSQTWLSQPEPAADFIAAMTNESLKTTPPEKSQTEDIKRQLRQKSISSLETANIAGSASESSKDDDLQKIIAQIRSITGNQEQSSQQQAKSAKPVIAPENQQADPVKPGMDKAVETKSEGPEFVSGTSPNGQSAEYKNDAVGSSPIVSERTLKTVDDLLKDPNKSQNLIKLGPIEAGIQYAQLAEVLFKSSKFREAGQCYKRAYELLPADDVNLVSERNWILFQAGNCFEYDDPNTARENFAQLLRTDSSSPWTDVAKFRHDLADWMQKEQPKKLIEDVHRKTESNQ
jgi:tetratricopeptide (TPR) repeat protein